MTQKLDYFFDYSCPVEAVMDVMGGKWKGVILFHLLNGRVMRFNEIRRQIPHATRRTLTRQLRELEERGLICRTVYPQVPPKVEYRLTECGNSLKPILLLLRDWGDDYLNRLIAANQHQPLPKA